MTELEKSKEIIQFIANAEKTTPVELYTDEEIVNSYSCKVIGKDGVKIVFGNWEEIEKIISKYFQNFKTYKETIKIDFENPLSVLRHLKYTGVTGFQRAPFSKIKSFKDNCLTYEVAYFICQK